MTDTAPIIRVFRPNTCPLDIAKGGMELVKRRQKDSNPNIDRSDLSAEKMAAIKSAVALRAEKVVGWVSLADDGEMCRGAIENDLVGKGLFTRLLVALDPLNSPRTPFGWVATDSPESIAAIWQALRRRMECTRELKMVYGLLATKVILSTYRTDLREQHKIIKSLWLKDASQEL